MSLEFKRTSRFNTEKLSARLRKDWISTKPTRYRITMRRVIFGVRVPRCFQATVLCHVPGDFDGGARQMWCFVDIKKRLFKTMHTALEACERHYKTWEKALQCPSMRTLKSLFNDRKPSEVPSWTFHHFDPHILNILMDRTPQRHCDYDDDTAYFDVEEIPVTLKVIEEAMGMPLPKKRGRPKGSKNKEKSHVNQGV